MVNENYDKINAKIKDLKKSFKEKNEIQCSSIEEIIENFKKLESTHDLFSLNVTDHLESLDDNCIKLDNKLTSHYNEISEINRSIAQIQDEVKTHLSAVQMMSDRLGKSEEKIEKAIQNIEEIKAEFNFQKYKTKTTLNKLIIDTERVYKNLKESELDVMNKKLIEHQGMIRKLFMYCPTINRVAEYNENIYTHLLLTLSKNIIDGGKYEFKDQLSQILWIKKKICSKGINTPYFKNI